MIIKIDHIALFSNFLEKSIELLKSCGYQVKFVEKDILNPKIKQALMTDFPQRYNICYMEHAKNLDIEIVTADLSSGQHSFLRPRIANLPMQSLLNTDNGLEISLDELIESDVHTDNNISNLNVITCHVKNIQESISFWKLLGFVNDTSDNSGEKIVFTSILPDQKNIQIAFREVANDGLNYYLNDLGFNCLAFITTSIERDCKKIVKNGFKSTDIEEIFINGRQIRVCFVIGKNGELAELIELSK